MKEVAYKLDWLTERGYNAGALTECSRREGDSLIVDVTHEQWAGEVQRVKASRIPAHSRGLGDTVAKAIKAVTLGSLKPCVPCAKRIAWLNRLLPYD